MISKKTILSLAGLAALAACGGKKKNDQISKIDPALQALSPTCHKYSLEEVENAANLWNVAELSDEAVVKLKISRGDEGPRVEKRYEEEYGSSTMSTAAFSVSFDNDGIRFNHNAMILSESNVNSRIEKGEVRATDPKTNQVRAIGLPEALGKTSKTQASLAPRTLLVASLGETYLIQGGFDELYLVHVDAIDAGKSIDLSYRKVAGFSGKNIQANDCAEDLEIKRQSEGEFEAIVYASDWDWGHSFLKMPIRPLSAGEYWYSTEALALRKGYGESKAWTLEGGRSSKVIDIGDRQLADINRDAFSTYPGGLPAFLSGKTASIEVKLNHTYLTMGFSSSAITYYAIRPIAIDPKGRWIEVRAKTVEVLAPFEFQAWRTVPAKEDEKVIEGEWSRGSGRVATLNLSLSLYHSYDSSNELKMYSGWQAMKGHYGFSKVRTPWETLDSLSDEDALDRLGKYESELKAETGLYIVMESQYATRTAYALEILSVDVAAEKMQVRVKKLLEQTALPVDEN